MEKRGEHHHHRHHHVNQTKGGFAIKNIHVIFISLILLAFTLVIALILFSTFSGKKNLPVSVLKKEKIIYAPKPTLPPGFDTSLQNGPFKCPVSLSFCQKKENYRPGLLSGNITNNSPIYAAFDGTLQVISIADPKATKSGISRVVVLTNLNRGLKAYYSFKGKPIVAKEAKEGTIIATSTGEKVSFYNTSFAFEIVKLGFTNGTKYILEPKLFK